MATTDAMPHTRGMLPRASLSTAVCARGIPTAVVGGPTGSQSLALRGRLRDRPARGFTSTEATMSHALMCLGANSCHLTDAPFGRHAETTGHTRSAPRAWPRTDLTRRSRSLRDESADLFVIINHEKEKGPPSYRGPAGQTKAGMTAVFVHQWCGPLEVFGGTGLFSRAYGPTCCLYCLGKRDETGLPQPTRKEMDDVARGRRPRALRRRPGAGA